MKKFNYCPIIEIGDVFTRRDQNGKIWKAEVINRTEYFVDVKKTQPYQIKVANEGFAGQCGCWHYEDAPDTFERCMLHRQHEEVEIGESEKQGLFGTYISKDYKRVPTPFYYIDCKEVYSKSYKWDKPYTLRKYGDGVEEPTIEPIDKTLDRLHNYFETGEWKED